MTANVSRASSAANGEAAPHDIVCCPSRSAITAHHTDHDLSAGEDARNGSARMLHEHTEKRDIGTKGLTRHDTERQRQQRQRHNQAAVLPEDEQRGAPLLAAQTPKLGRLHASKHEQPHRMSEGC